MLMNLPTSCPSFQIQMPDEVAMKFLPKLADVCNCSHAFCVGVQNFSMLLRINYKILKNRSNNFAARST